MKNDGRPQKYTDEELLLELKKYREKHPNTKIKLVDLERETGIPVHIWKYRLNAYIKEINNNTTEEMTPKTEGFCLPSAHDMLINCMDNPDLIEQNFEMLLDIIHTLQCYKDASATIENIKTNYENKIQQLECEKKDLMNQNTKLNDTMNRYILDSASLNKRKQLGIKDNIIKFNPDNMQQFQDMFNELLE